MPKAQKTVLIIEDEAPMLRALADKFTKEGLSVLGAGDGEEGLATAEKEHPDLLLVDIIMPKIDGITVVKRIREGSKWGREVPVIMLTNLSDPASVSEAAKLGVYDFLVKTDWRLDDVIKLVKERLHLENK